MFEVSQVIDVLICVLALIIRYALRTVTFERLLS